MSCFESALVNPNNKIAVPISKFDAKVIKQFFDFHFYLNTVILTVITRNQSPMIASKFMFSRRK